MGPSVVISKQIVRLEASAKVSIKSIGYYFDPETVRDCRILVRRNRIKSLLFPQPEMSTKIR